MGMNFSTSSWSCGINGDYGDSRRTGSTFWGYRWRVGYLQIECKSNQKGAQECPHWRYLNHNKTVSLFLKLPSCSSQAPSLWIMTRPLTNRRGLLPHLSISATAMVVTGICVMVSTAMSLYKMIFKMQPLWKIVEYLTQTNDYCPKFSWRKSWNHKFREKIRLVTKIHGKYLVHGHGQ